MHKVKLGETGFEVSKLCVGTDYADFYGNEKVGGALLRRAYELGLNFWDTADTYGAYAGIRGALKTLDRSKIVITSKTYAKDRSEAEMSIGASLREMHTPFIDIFMLHAVDSMEEYNGRSGALKAVLEAKRRGLVHAVGVSTHSARVTRALADVSEIEVVLTVLNRAGLRMSGTLTEMESAAKMLYEGDKGVYLMKVLARGRLADDVESALSYAYGLPYVHSASVGMTSLDELETNVRIVNKLL